MTFQFQAPRDMNAALAEVRRQAAKKGVTFVGDTSRGKFSGIVSGHYEVSRGMVSLTITSKPFYISWKAVGDMIRKFFG